MQCAACRAVYSNALDICPKCLQPKLSTSHVPTKEVANVPHPESGTVPKKTAQRTARATNRGGSADETQAAAAEVPPASAAGGAASTLIEFPGTGRANANRPQWRKELSERVREIQSRRAREAAIEAERAALRELEQETLAAEAEEEETAPAPLGLVASNDTTPLNPLVAAALRRIERARQPPPRPRAKAGGGAAAAVARVVKEQYETPVEPEVAPPPPQPPRRVAPAASASETEIRSGENTGRMKETSRPSGLIVVRPAPPSEVEPPNVEAPPAEPLTETQPATLAETVSAVAEAAAAEPSDAPPPPAVTPAVAPPTPVAPSTQVMPADVEPAVNMPAAEETSKPVPRRVCAGVIDDHWLDRREVEMRSSALPADEQIDDRAPLASRFVGAVIDLVVIAFIASPFAAVIELTSGAWSDPRVAGSMVGILITVMLLYMVVSTGLAGRTLGMWLLSLRVVDVRTAMVPQTGQSVRRAVAYVMSLAAFGLGFLYALLDAEGRAAHDHLSGTMVVRD